MNFIKTCERFPEQYDVFNSSGHKIGYLRLRFGTFEVYKSDEDKSPLYCKVFGNEYKGEFADDTERKQYLEIAKKVLNSDDVIITT